MCFTNYKKVTLNSNINVLILYFQLFTYPLKMKEMDLFDIGKKGFLNKNEQIVFEIFDRKYKFESDEILDMEITEDNINHLINKFDLKITKNDVKEMIKFIKQ